MCVCVCVRRQSNIYRAKPACTFSEKKSHLGPPTQWNFYALLKRGEDLAGLIEDIGNNIEE